jgi:hypothetical protein
MTFDAGNAHPRPGPLRKTRMCAAFMGDLRIETLAGRSKSAVLMMKRLWISNPRLLCDLIVRDEAALRISFCPYLQAPPLGHICTRPTLS